MIVGALPSWLRNHEPNRQYRVTTDVVVAEGMSLEPETYVLNEDDHLVMNDALSARLSRFVAAEVPAGICRVDVFSGGGKPVFSELILTSPKVLSVLGPY